MPDVVSPVRTISICMIPAPFQIPLLQILENLIASETQQGPDKFDFIGEDTLRPDATKPAKTRAAAQSLEDGLGIVVFLMRRSDSAAFVDFCYIDQSIDP